MHVRVFMASELGANGATLGRSRTTKRKSRYPVRRRNESPTTARLEHEIRTLAPRERWALHANPKVREARKREKF